MSRLFVIAVTYTLLLACATQTPDTDQGTQTPEPAAPAVKVAERAFPDDSLYALLVAEFALRRQAFDVALEQYMEQAPQLRDAGVSAHTTHLTQYLQREDDALQAAQLWVELEPDNAEANNTLAELLARKGRALEALPHLVVVERQTGSANFPIVLNGFNRLSEEQRAQLLREVNDLTTEFPQNTQLLITLALIYSDFDQPDNALNALDRLFEIDPEQPQAILLEARILADQDAPNPYAHLQRVLHNNPDARLLRLQYARLLAVSDMSAAREQFEVLSEQFPQDADLLISLALITRETGDAAAASTYLHQVIALGQRVDEAYYYLGRIAEEQGDPEQAISYYSQVSEGPEYLAAVSRAGQILVEKGQLDRSHTWFDEQREQSPQLREQLYGLEADILARAGAQKNAMQVLNQALAQTPGSTSLRYARAMLSEQLNDLAAMERDLRTLLAADPDNATALNALGYTLADRTTRYTEALQLISRALELQPDEPAILDSMGWVMFRTGRYEESIKYLSRAYASFPDSEVASHLGEALWVKGDKEAAITVWQGAMLRDPDNAVLVSTLKRLGVELPRPLPASNAPAPSLP